MAQVGSTMLFFSVASWVYDLKVMDSDSDTYQIDINEEDVI